MNEEQKPRRPWTPSDLLIGGAAPRQEERLWARIRARRGGRQLARVPLAAPLGRFLRTGDELLVDRARIWRDVRARSTPARARRTLRIKRTAWALASALLLSLVSVSAWRWPSAGPERALDPQGALRLAAGGRIAPMEAHAQPHTVRFSDASQVRLEPGSRVVPLVSTDTSFELLLAHGSAEFSVTPGGSRRWVVDAGSARIEVVGTVFRVARDENRVRVRVRRGSVLVRGESVPGWVRKLTAGQSLTLQEKAAPEARAPGASASSAQAGLTRPGTEPPAAEGQPGASADARSAPTSPLGEARAPAETRQGRKPSQPPRRPGSKRRPAAPKWLRTSSIEALLELADEARLSGHPRRAVAPLQHALARFSDSPQAALAAFTLGRLRLDQLNEPRRAAAAFEQAIARRPPRALQADCHRRLVEAYGRAGNPQAAKRAFERFRTLFPEQARREDLQRWLPR